MDYKTFKEIFNDVTKIIGNAAPVIGGLIGSPSTGIIVGLLAAISNTDACDHCGIANALANDPDLYAKLQNLEKTHAEWLKKIN